MLLSILWPGHVLADTGVVFGSYVKRQYADEKRQEVKNSLGMSTVVLTADVDGTAHYRVIAIESSYRRALQMREIARSNEIDVWVLDLSTPSYSSEVLSELEDQTQP